MKIVYIAHPIGGDVENNLASLRRIIYNINRYEENTVPFCPYYADVVALDDNNHAQRTRGLKNDMAILSRPGMVDELRLCGHKISQGMKMEIEQAYYMGIPIKCDSQEMWKMFEPILAELRENCGLIT